MFIDPHSIRNNNTVNKSILYYLLSYLDQNGEMMKRAEIFVTRSYRYVLITTVGK